MGPWSCLRLIDSRVKNRGFSGPCSDTIWKVKLGPKLLRRHMNVGLLFQMTLQINILHIS